MTESRGTGAGFLPAFVLGAFVCAGLIGVGWWATRGALEVKGLERSVTVKGLAEREVPADIAIWPIAFTGLNDLKPGMIEAATRNAREVANKFAADSDSTLGKIRRARQRLFTIEDRDSNTPYVKQVRVVSTVEYYLSD